MFIDAAPEVPKRTSSPFNMLAKTFMRDVLVELRRYAIDRDRYEPAELVDEASRLLAEAEARLARQMERNVFLQEPGR